MRLNTRLSSLGRPSLSRRERGATAVVTVILLVPVLFGAAALSIDVGNLMAERRQVQNGADAAAMVAARACVKSAAGCPAASTLTPIAGRNANDGVTDAVQVCSNPAKPLLTGVTIACLAASGEIDCPAPTARQQTFPYVEVRTQTRTTQGTTALTNKFARMLLGGSPDTAVGACARVGWGAPAGGSAGAPITISGCDWMHATGGDAGGGHGAYLPMPDYATYPSAGYGGTGVQKWPAAPATPPAQNPGGEVVLLIQNPPGGHTPPSSCSNWQGHALPGGFGLLEAVSGQPCKLKEYDFNWMHTDTGNQTDCNLSLLVGKVISLPVFDCTDDALPGLAGIPPAGDPNCDQGNGSNGWFHRQGYAYFYLSGYSVTTAGGTPNKVKSVNPNFNAFPCASSESCISGWFVQGELKDAPLGDPLGGAGDFGTYTFNYLG
jgi:Flp pilus assembly protein TadG